MAQAAPVCCADPRGSEQQQNMSTGLPSPPRTPPGSPEPQGAGEPARADGRAPGARFAPARRGRWAPSPAFTRAETLWVIAAGVLLAVVTSWPLVLHLPSRIAPDLGDPVRTAWEVAWVGHAMLSNPLHLFDANAFYPHPLSLAFSDSLLGYGPAGFFGSGTFAALVRYNLLFLFAWSLCFIGAYLLARELGLGRLAGAAAGVAFAYAPYRVTEAGHLHVISSGGIPLALFLLLRGYRRGSRGLVIAGWLVSAWQVSLGFTLGLQYCYLLAVLALLALFCWWRGELRLGVAEPAGATAPGGPPDSAEDAGKPATASARGPLVARRLLAVTIVGMALVGIVGVYQARPYLKVSHDYPTAKRTLKEVKTYSAGPAALLAASSENRVWGGATEGMRAKVHSKNESVFFPGGLILLLAAIGLAGVRGSPFTPRLRLGLALGILICSILALGLGLTGAGYPFRLVHDYAPGWNGVRVPGRVFTLATLFYALLVGAGAQLLARRVGPWGERHSLRALPAVLGVALVIGIVGEGAGHLAHPVVPQPARAEIGLRGPILDLPTDGPADRLWQYFSTDGFYKIPVGNSTFDIKAVDDLRGGMSGFPDRASIEKLRFYGIRTVVLHLRMPTLPGIHGYALAEPPDTAAAAAKPVAGLGVTRRRVGSIVIYEIGPGPAALHGTN
ncbi:MAG: hypothetical protein QOI89_364 [Solirubrobacteraceae bacterium]|jgi:hypothetical protein|nr:hypothetical protein [Solirubrobacteraceae bacterium]